MRPTNNHFFKVIYVPVWCLILYHYKVISQDLDEDLIPDLYAKYEEAVRSNDTNTDENTESLRRLFRNDKEYRVHVKKLKEVNGYKKHNLMIKSILRTNDTIIYINNPVESKIPNTYLTIEEFKKILRDRVDTKKDAYSILHKPKMHYNFKHYKILPLKRVSFTKHKMQAHISTDTHWTKSQNNAVKIQVRETTEHSRNTVAGITNVQKHTKNKTSVLTVPNLSKRISKSDAKIKNMTINNFLVRTILKNSIKSSQTDKGQIVEQSKITTSLKSTADESKSQTIVQNVKEQVVITEVSTTESILDKTLKENKYSIVIASSTDYLNIISSPKEEIESEMIQIKFKSNNSSENIDNVPLSLQKSSIPSLDLNTTDEIYLNVADSIINEENKIANKSVLHLNVTKSNLNSGSENVYHTTVNIGEKESMSDITLTTLEGVVDTQGSTVQGTYPWLRNLTEEKKDATDSAVKIYDKVTLSDVTETTSKGTVLTEESTIQETYPWLSYLDEEKKDITDSVVNTDDTGSISNTTETTSEGIKFTEESTIQEPYPWYRPKRGKTRLRTTKATTKRTRRTYGRPRVFMEG